MFTSPLILASGISIQLGNNTWSFNTNLLIYLLVAAVVGIVAESIVGWKLPFGIVGSIIAALLGIWLMTSFIVITGVDDINVGGIPVIRALIGAIILVALWHALTYRTWQPRRRDYYRRDY